jgi:hypothetical protein
MIYPEANVRNAVSNRRFHLLLAFITLLVALTGSVSAQVTTGNVRGVVKDESGAVIAGAKVTITDAATKSSQTVQASSEGEFQFVNLPGGEYSITVESTNFKKTTLSQVIVSLNRTTDVQVTLAPGGESEVIEVSAANAGLIETSTSNLGKSFDSRQTVELSQTASAGGIYNLALIAGNVSSSGGVGVGTGGSVGGQRPRNNNFTVDGIDNNDKAVTGPQIYISPETVAEFTLLSNQFSAEFSRSNGGQFITVTKSGTNQFHGTAYGFFQNRRLNALDTQQILGGTTRDTNPRSDYSRHGGNIGGPIVKDRLWFFASFERQQTGAAASPAGILSFTSDGFNQLGNVPGLSATNLAVLRQYLPVAPTATDTIQVGNALIPVGNVTFDAPSFSTQRNFVLNLDFKQSDKTTHRTRFIFDRIRAIDTAANLPAFFNPIPVDGRLFSYTTVHSFTPSLTNEFRFSYRRYLQSFQVPNITYPNLDSFPNIQLNDLGINIGPDPNAPQFNIENNYQFIDNVSWNIGNHSLKFGIDARKLISPQSFVQRQRGDYTYNTTDSFLRDLSPDFGERTVGASPYYGDQKLFFAYAQDDWRIHPTLTLNLGIRYSYQQVPFTARQQSLNAAASVPGLINFKSPSEQTTNFAPVVGLAYAPNFNGGFLGKVFGRQGDSSLRAGFSLGYDVIFDNLYILSLPPQFNQTRNVETPGVPGFLAGGGIPPTPNPVTGTPEELRSITSAFIPDQKVPYSMTWTLGFQRQLFKDYSFEIRYVGTRGVHLLTQNRINRQPRVTPNQFLPTFTSAPTQAQIDSLTTSLSQIQANSSFVPAFANAGFNAGNLVGFLSNGNSTYHGLSLSVQKRFSKNFLFNSAYTYSHLIDDTTAEVFSTVFSPRRVQDFQNLRAERSTSALDSTHRFVLSGIYEVPYFRDSQNRLARALLGGFSLSSTMTFETGKPFTPLSGVDANLNGDNAGDRTVINPNGVSGTASAVTPLITTAASPLGAGQTVGYVAVNGNAQYIQAGPGAFATAGRNTVRLPGIANFDFAVFKNFRLGERTRFQFRADFYNVFNHAQYTAGSVRGVNPVATTSAGATRVNTVAFGGVTNIDFNRPQGLLSSNPRVIQLALRFDF